MGSIRRPAVAGTFYRNDPHALRAELEECFCHHLGPRSVPAVDPQGQGLVRGLLCPHAGLQYSGPAAAWSYKELAGDGAPEVIVLVGPNHTGMGQAVALSGAAAWSTPLGDMAVDMRATERILAECPVARVDDAAHRFEHALEVQLPFLQYLLGDGVPIVPIALRTVSATAEGAAEALRLEQLGQALAEALRGRRGVVIASSDLTHFEPHDVATEKDRPVLARALALDAPGMLHAVDARGVTMCGVLAVATMIYCVSAMGAAAGRLLTYYTSGDITGDKREVVGYAAASFAVELP
jgi:AmmeMemoRadiSam system protein B